MIKHSMGMLTFQNYMRKKGFELSYWQNRAASALLGVMQENYEGGSGKTFLMKHLFDFVADYGNCIEIEDDPDENDGDLQEK